MMTQAEKSHPASIQGSPQPLSAFFKAPGPDLEIVGRAKKLQALVREHAAAGDDAIDFLRLPAHT
jgi:hypothetical protein